VGPGHGVLVESNGDLCHGGGGPMVLEAARESGGHATPGLAVGGGSGLWVNWWPGEGRQWWSRVLWRVRAVW